MRVHAPAFAAPRLIRFGSCPRGSKGRAAGARWSCVSYRFPRSRWELERLRGELDKNTARAEYGCWMASRGVSASTDRVAERRRAVALARHFREAEGLSSAQIADRLGRSPATVKAYFYDPTGEKARAVKARYVGMCRGCGAYTQPRNGKGDAYAYCKRCHPGAIARRWTQERVLDAMRDWRGRYGRLPTSYDWSSTHAHRRGGDARARLAEGEWPAASVVTRLSAPGAPPARWPAQLAGEMTREPASASSSFGRDSISLPKPRESTAISEDRRGGEPKPEPIDLQVLLTAPANFAHNSGR